MVLIGTDYSAIYWLNSEPCGFICGCMTYLLISFGMYATSIHVIVPMLGYNSVLGIVNLFLFNCSSLLAAYSHLSCMTTNPGAVPKEAVPLEDDEQEHNFALQRAEISQTNGQLYKKYCKKCKGKIKLEVF